MEKEKGWDLVVFGQAPTAGGQVGQVFYYEYGPDLVIAPSFAALLAQWAEWLEVGYYQLDKFGGKHLEATREDTTSI